MKAEWWLRFAANHALPITKKSLVTAADDLHQLHEDIGQGKLITANQLDQAIARADQALAEWHYFQAKDNLGRDEENLAAQNLQAAGRYLQEAARSARFENGADTASVFEDVDNDGKLVDEGVSIERNRLNDNLTALQTEVNKDGCSAEKGVWQVISNRRRVVGFTFEKPGFSEKAGLLSFVR